MFQNEILQFKFSQADLKTVSVKKIPAKTTCPVRLGTATGSRQTPMAAGSKSVSTMGNIDNPQLFTQSGLVVSDHQGDVTIMLQNMSDVDIEIPQCTTIGFISNLDNEYFNKIPN
jgi:dUTPase